MLVHPVLKRVQKQVMSDLNLYFEIIHNLVIEVTKLGVENHNLKMKVESLSSRLGLRRASRTGPGRRGAVPAAAAASAATPGQTSAAAPARRNISMRCATAAVVAAPVQAPAAAAATQFVVGSGGPAGAGRTALGPARSGGRAAR
jgi:hypothetical protein